MQKGNVAWAVSQYIRLQQSIKAVERNESTLHSWLSGLTSEEVQEYAKQTTEMDERRNQEAA